MFRWPSKVTPGFRDEAAISVDIAPTILASLGLEVNADMQGINLLDPLAVQNRRAIYGECFTHNAVDIDRPESSLRWRWMIEGDYKLIVPADQNEPKAKTELYRIDSDPYERDEISQQHSELAAKMRKSLDDWYSGEVSK
jgi:uncharacterized sulfatase